MWTIHSGLMYSNTIKKLYDTKRQESLEIKDVYGEPIHFNTNIKRGKKVIFVKEWELHGILQIKDLMDENHRFLDFIAFKAKYNVTQTNFMLYFGIISAIKRYLVQIENNRNCKSMLLDEVWACIMAGNKTVKATFQDDKNLPTASIKWNLEFENLNWTRIFIKCFKVSSDPKLQWFQARLLHRILPTKKYLALCNLTDSSRCVFCDKEVETLNHLFWNCEHVQKFWNDLKLLLDEKCPHCSRLNLTKELILFGTKENTFTDSPIDFIILFAKFYIYKTKLNETRPHIKQFVQQLKFRITIEKALACKNNKEHTFENNWRLYKPLFE